MRCWPVLPLSRFPNLLLAAVSAENRPLRAADFVQFAGLHELTPDLAQAGGSLSLVRFYYGVISAVDMLVGARVPAVAHGANAKARSARVTQPFRLASACKAIWNWPQRCAPAKRYFFAHF